MDSRAARDRRSNRHEGSAARNSRAASPAASTVRVSTPASLPPAAAMALATLGEVMPMSFEFAQNASWVDQAHGIFTASGISTVSLSDIIAKWLSPNPGDRGPMPMAQELAMRPELDLEIFEELRQSLNWQLPPLRKIYQSIRESARKAIAALGGGAPTDLELAQRRVHALQGGAGLVGARQIEHVAARLGQALREVLRISRVDRHVLLRS